MDLTLRSPRCDVTDLAARPPENKDVILHQNSKHKTRDFKNENRIVHQITIKLTAAKAIVTKADKGNSMIIIPEADYNNKVQNFIANNNFTLTPQDNTKGLQRIMRTAINECKDIIPKEAKWRHVSLNPTAPKIRGLIKIHKEDSPIRPVVNWKNAPTYKLARSLVK